MRILNVTPWLAHRYGGPATLVPQASVALRQRGHTVEIVTTNVDGHGVLDVPTGHVVEWAGAAVTFHPVSAPRWYLTSWPLLSDLRRRASTFDIVHIHSLYRFHGLAAALTAKKARVPYVIQAHGALDPWTRDRKRRAKDIYHLVLEDRIIHGASAIVCTSAREQDSIRQLGYTTPIFAIPCGIDGDALRETPQSDLLAGHGVDGDARIVTFLGRISKIKGVDLLVESFKRTAAAFPDAHLIIAGPDDEGIRFPLTRMVADAGMSSRVSFIGPVAGADKRALLQRSNVVVLPSLGESFGIAAGEAMAVGCPVVVSPGVAINDVVQATGAGLVAEREPAELARAVETILADRATATRMGEAGRSAADRLFAWPVVTSEMEAMYMTVLAGHRGRSHCTRPGGDA